MGEVDSWVEEKFREVFEDETRLLNRRFSKDASCSIEELEGILASFYLLEGMNQEGKVQEIVLSATIAAYEAFIFQKKESK